MIIVDDLAKIIEANVIRYDQRLSYEEAFDLAQHVLNFFGYANRIIDNVLEPEDRDAFYMLEDYGILATEREEITLYDGREWRIHYWLFNTDRIYGMIQTAVNPKEVSDPVADMYAALPADAWDHAE